MDEIIKICAKYLIIVPVLVDAWLLYKLDRDNRRWMIALLIGGGILAALLAGLGGHFYNDPRPQFKDGSVPLFAHGNDNGFPSDHTLLASFLAFIAWPFSRKISYSLLAVALVIGWARVAAHVHHATDIIGSILITGLAFWLVNRLYVSKVNGADTR